MEKQRTSQIKGTGSISVPPDFVTIRLRLFAMNPDYASMATIDAQQADMLAEAVEEAGFSSSDLKTEAYSIQAKYEDEALREDGRKVERRVLSGYRCNRTMSLSFDLDLSRLGRVMEAIGSSLAKPEIRIAFSVKDEDGLKDRVLAAAAKDARRKATVLAKAMGVELGDLLRVVYDWDEFQIRHSLDMDYMAYDSPKAASIFESSLHPGNVESEDTASFIWEIR